ncbi:MAG: DUF5783 family protein [Halobacteriaceae archaeon]
MELTEEEFEQKKYTEYFSKLQTAYKQAFDEVNTRYDSALVHTIDQQIFAESEPVFNENEVKLPDESEYDLDGIDASEEEIDQAVDAYATAIEEELIAIFDEQKA